MVNIGYGVEIENLHYSIKYAEHLKAQKAEEAKRQAEERERHIQAIKI